MRLTSHLHMAPDQVIGIKKTVLEKGNSTHHRVKTHFKPLYLQEQAFNILLYLVIPLVKIQK